MYINLCWPNISYATKYISTCVAHILRCLWIHKIYLNFCWQYLSHDSEDTKYISTCVEQNPLDSEEKRCKPSKPIPCQRGNKKYLYLCWTKPHSLSAKTYDFSKIVLNKYHQCQREHKIHVKTFVDQNHPMPAMTQKTSQHVLTKHLTCQRRH